MRKSKCAAYLHVEVNLDTSFVRLDLIQCPVLSY
jgi:hypothetical protein